MESFWCELHRDSSVPLYEQLYTYIKSEITEGRLPYGTKLPSKRKMAEFLKVSQNTIETAYEQLQAEGYVEVKARKGYFVQASDELEYIPRHTKEEIKTLPSKEQYQYNFHPSQIDPREFPFDRWRKHARNVVAPENHHLLLLGDTLGEMELREEIRHYLYHSRGVKCHPDQIVVGAGVEVLLQQLVLLLGSDKIYGIEDPGYHMMLKIIQHYPNEAIPISVDAEGVQVEQLQDLNVDIVYTTPSHHFPYGSVLSINRRHKLLTWAEENTERYIIEDDYDSEFRYSGKTIPSLHSMDRTEKVIYLGTFSKSLMPSIRISYMVLPNNLLDIFKQKFAHYHSTVSRIDQVILASFMKSGDFEKHLNRMRKIYRKKLEKVLSLLKTYEESIQLIGEHSGLHIVLKINNDHTENELIDLSAKANMKVYPLSNYSLKKGVQDAPQFLLGFAHIPEHELERAINQLLKAWHFK
ncbi:PLP-dependent aminotransferase family protein [Alkalihalobacillus pseudalcaliphilus]|uniref:MocR-like pyridoxine biosynthesis transcription factor PdxR n=1 Tax=Alkalihalobacillus pseudalcaliphilus TaxID=79884 RepID=UPI00064DE278|nr:PLP-dependent aminotransferase family protein [Alkalihalobacillus pseudalcaliphilus]KMK76226.1 GntR family transcriptional regulator [Alkalihalobacillus pseudalcaliphilus]